MPITTAFLDLDAPARVAALGVIVTFIHSPIQEYVNQPAPSRDPFLLDPYLDDLFDLTHFLRSTCFRRVPPCTYSTYTSSTHHLNDQLLALRDGLTSDRARLVQNVTGFRGKIEFDEVWLRELYDLGYTDRRIAGHFNCCTKTIARRRHDLGLDRNERLHRHTNEQIENAIIHFLNNTHADQVGYQMIQGHLRAEGLLTPRDHMQALVKAIDPEAVELRTGHTIDRRHKLINWKIVIHGGIDGKSHLIPYMGASDNNHAKNHLALFQAAVTEWGYPMRIRADHGGENNMIRDEIETVRGLGRGSFMMGRSVHNVRIERLWREVGARVTGRYAQVFSALEFDEEILDRNNAIDLYCLHHVFLPYIRHSVDLFVKS